MLVLSLQAQQETQKAALSYERAVSMHTAAREMVYVAEQGLMADGKNTLDPTWQEMLNHATAKVLKGRPWTCCREVIDAYLHLADTKTFSWINCTAGRWAEQLKIDRFVILIFSSLGHIHKLTVSGFDWQGY